MDDDEEEEEDELEAEEGFNEIVEKETHTREDGPNARDIDNRRRLDEMLSLVNSYQVD